MSLSSRRFSPRSVIFVAVVLLLIAGCGNPKISPPAYELTRTLCNVCNLRQNERLADFEKLLESRRSASEISDVESRLLTRIVAIARAGDWARAEQTAREILRDQAS